MSIEELTASAEKLRTTVGEMRSYLKVDQRRETLQALEQEALADGFWDKPEVAREVIAKTNAQRAFVRPYDDLLKAVDDLELMLQLSEESGGDADALAEAESAAKLAEELIAKLRLMSLLSGKLDSCGAYITIHAGAGGTESCDWAGMLQRMYHMYCEDAGFEIELLDQQDGEEAGIKSATFAVNGGYAYGYLKAERGVHRLVRISPFDANKRRHTSFASIDVIAQINDDIEVEIKEEDLRIDTYRSGGKGGQHVNKTDSAVRLTHIPTGIVVAVQSERSQHKNKAKAFSMLRAKLYEYYEDKQRRDMERFYGEKGEIAWGSQIRSYVFQPYTMVKDLRTGCETSNVQAVMNGDIQRFIEAWLRHRATTSNSQA